MSDYKILMITNFSEAEYMAADIACKITSSKLTSIHFLCNDFKSEAAKKIKNAYKFAARLQAKYDVYVNLKFSSYESWFEINNIIKQAEFNLVMLSGSHPDAEYIDHFLESSKDSKCSLLVFNTEDKYNNAIDEVVYVTNFKEAENNRFKEAVELAKLEGSYLSILNPNPKSLNLGCVPVIDKMSNELQKLPPQKRGTYYIENGISFYLKMTKKLMMNSLLFFP